MELSKKHMWIFKIVIAIASLALVIAPFLSLFLNNQ